MCPWHWYRFDLDSGACATSPRHRLAVHPVLRVDGAWFADVGEKPPTLSWSERLRAHARGTSWAVRFGVASEDGRRVVPAVRAA